MTGCKYNGQICPNCGKRHKDITGDKNVSKRIEVRKKMSENHRDMTGDNNHMKQLKHRKRMINDNPMNKPGIREKHLTNILRGVFHYMNNISLKLKHLKSVRSENCRRLHRENNAMKNSETRKKASETKKKLFLSGKLKISKKCKEKHREKHKGKTYEEIHGKEKALKLKKQRRYIAIQRVEKQKLNGKPLTPLHGKYEKNILDNLEKSLGFKIQRQKRVAGYFLDGYIPSLNLAIEIDEPHHFTFNNKLKNKDISRQKEIEQEIRCQFLRIKISKGVKN